LFKFNNQAANNSDSTGTTAVGKRLTTSLNSVDIGLKFGTTEEHALVKETYTFEFLASLNMFSPALDEFGIKSSAKLTITSVC
jgi:hypothetical protein